MGEAEKYYRDRNEKMRRDVQQSVSAQESAIRQKVRQDQLRRLREAQAKATKKSKYGNHKTVRFVDGEQVTFDSEREARRWDELVLLQKAGKIKHLRRQVKYKLIPAQRDLQGHVIEKACDYIADFVYYEIPEEPLRHPVQIVEDAKGYRTDAYVIKRKMMLRKYGIRIREV